MDNLLLAEADKALQIAKINLLTMKKSSFISTIAYNLKYQWDETISTAAVDGVTVYVNPQFFLDANKEKRIFVVAHEAWHVALNHLFRGVGKIQKIYNEAGDYVINQLLKDAVPAYEMWDWVLQDDKYRNLSTNQVYDLLLTEPPPEDKSNKMSNDIKEPAKENKEKVEQQVKEIIIKAATLEAITNPEGGNLPKEIKRQIDELINPELPWESILDRFLTDVVKDDYSWKRPNKRFAPEFYMPTMYSHGLGHLVVAIDTSGSVSKIQLTEMLSEIIEIKDKFNPKLLTIIDCDNRINHIHEVTEDTNILDLEFTGGGGTSFEPVINYCKENEPQALLYFTDLYARDITEEQTYPVIWLCYSQHKESTIGETIYYKPK